MGSWGVRRVKVRRGEEGELLGVAADRDRLESEMPACCPVTPCAVLRGVVRCAAVRLVVARGGGPR